MEGSTLIWELVKDNFEQARSHEAYREKVVSLTLAVAGVFLAALAVDDFAKGSLQLFGCSIEFKNLIGGFLIMTGVLGALGSMRHYERNRMHVALGQDYLEKLSGSKKELFPFDVSRAFTEFIEKKEWKAARCEWIKLSWLWLGVPVIVTIAGAMLVLSSSIDYDPMPLEDGCVTHPAQSPETNRREPAT